MDVKVGDTVSWWTFRGYFEMPKKLFVSKVYKKYFETTGGDQWHSDDGSPRGSNNKHHRSTKVRVWSAEHDAAIERYMCHELLCRASRDGARLKNTPIEDVRLLSDALSEFLKGIER